MMSVDEVFKVAIRRVEREVPNVLGVSSPFVVIGTRGAVMTAVSLQAHLKVETWLGFGTDWWAIFRADGIEIVEWSRRYETSPSIQYIYMVKELDNLAAKVYDQKAADAIDTGNI
jgi:Golgi nucleoside diphosphatase